MSNLRVLLSGKHRATTVIALCAGTLAAGPVAAGGLLTYEFGTAEVGLASAGYGARAQDASTVFTNPAGMTRLDGTQLLLGGQLVYGRTEFSIGSGTSPGLGTNDGGNGFGSDGWFLGGGMEAQLTILPPGWFVRSEYRYASYDSATLPIFSTVTGRVSGAGGFPTDLVIKPVVQTIRSEIVYKFNWNGPVAAKF